MRFDSFGDFLAMGGHGLYVWSAYGITLLVLLLNYMLPVLNARRYLREHKQSLRRQAAAMPSSEPSGAGDGQ